MAIEVNRRYLAEMFYAGFACAACAEIGAIGQDAEVADGLAGGYAASVNEAFVDFAATFLVFGVGFVFHEGSHTKGTKVHNGTRRIFT
jgi:hypothetical protein